MCVQYLRAVGCMSVCMREGTVCCKKRIIPQLTVVPVLPYKLPYKKYTVNVNEDEIQFRREKRGQKWHTG